MGTKDVFERLKDYYLDVAKVLRGEASAASIFPNTTDIGTSRERVYVEFLRQHAPSKCNVFLGGFLFDDNGAESKQLDVIVTTDTAPRYDLHNQNGGGKSFSPVEGTLGVVSIKSNLDKAELHDALSNIASIPPVRPIAGRHNPLLEISGYDDWPLKIVYATNGIGRETLLGHLNQYYLDNAQIPLTRRPNFIHVAGQYFISRPTGNMQPQSVSGQATTLRPDRYHAIWTEPDLQAIIWTLNELQKHASTSTHILYSYGEIINGIVKRLQNK